MVALGVDAAAGDPESPLAVTADGFRAAGRELGALGLPTVIVQEGGYDLATIGALVRAALAGLEARGRRMDDPLGRVAATRPTACRRSRARTSRRRRTGGSRRSPRPSGRARCRSARTAAAPSSSRTATRPTSGCSTSTSRVPQRLTTGRDPMPYWEDTAPRLSPDGSQVAYADGGHVWVVPPRAGRRGGCSRPSARSGSTTRRWSSPSSAATRRGSPSSRVADPWPRRLARGDRATTATSGPPAVSPDRTEVAYVFTPRDDLKRSEIRVADVAGRRRARAHGHAADAGPRPAWSPDGARSPTSERSGSWALHLVGATAAASGSSRPTAPTTASPPGTRTATASLVARRCATASASRSSTRARARSTSSRPAASGARRSGRPTATCSPPTRTTHAAPSCGWSRQAAPSGAVLAPAPLAVRSAPPRRPEDVTFPSRDGLEIPGFLYRPADASPERPVPAIVYPHGGPTDAYADDWDGHAQYFLDKGYAWLGGQLPRLDRLRPRLRAREPRRLGRRGRMGLPRRRRPPARRSTGSTATGSAIFGASYGSYMALLSVTDDPEHRFRCAVAKYGDCDILTSWAQGDREGVQDLERMMGHPATARAAYRAGLAVHRLDQVAAPLLIAHGERDERVSPKQSEELVAELRRLGKTFEYVTYPTEAHGFLRAGPQVHFYRRLERFLDWYLYLKNRG